MLWIRLKEEEEEDKSSLSLSPIERFQQIAEEQVTCLKGSMELENYLAREWKPVSAPAAEHSSGCFDCNICLDFASEPVVTLCGHLYCWPCIYRWLHVQSASLACDEPPQCPVCKADISHTAMVPLYGRGGRPEPTAMSIPPRPVACDVNVLASPRRAGTQHLPYRNPYQSRSHFADDRDDEENVDSGRPVVEMVYGRVFGRMGGSYRLTGGVSPRMRRQEIQAEKSLNRVSIFLLCCFLLCLIVF